jgi:membrane protein YqaA with SNARE-associated domain
MGIMDSSFLMLPFGNDLVVITMVVRNHGGYPWYVLAATCGAVTGTLLLDVVARRIGETGVRHMAGDRRFEYLKSKIGERGGIAVVLACVSPPPFPFTAILSTVCALGYPRKKLLALVAISRAVRFLILGALAIRYGRLILRVANSTPFRWGMTVFIVVCVVGSLLSVIKWFRRDKGNQSKNRPMQQPAPSEQIRHGAQNAN